MSNRITFKAILISCLLAASPALADPAEIAANDPLIEGAKQCTRHLAHYEREYGIPTHLLSAIASTESGRYHEGLGMRIPWPWTINVEGKGYYFDTKEEAVAAVRKFHARGYQSIDVGCMQVNLVHHPEAFASLDAAFDPETNIAYAASFLRSLYQDNGNWRKAAADYHSKTVSLGNQYVSQVYNSWYRIIDKLRAANQAVPETTVAEMNTLKPASGYVTPAAYQSTRPIRTSRLPEQQGRKVAAYHEPRMNSIRVSQKQSDVVIVKPEIKLVDNSPIIVAAQPSVNQIGSTTDVPDAKIIPVDHTVVATPDSHRSGPNFVFSD